jgi:tetratricopeptide (TPR) repeat protein
MRNFNNALELYNKCVEKEPTHSEALARIAELYYRRGLYEQGILYARRVLEFSAYDGAANFIYGALQEKLNNQNDAEEAFSIASRTMEFRSAAFTRLSGIEIRKGNFDQALNYARKALDYNKNNLTAAAYTITANRKLNKTGDARAAIEALLHLDPLSHYARFEQYLFAADTAKGRIEFQSLIKNESPQETYLELAIQYANLGLNEEAINVLQLAPSYPTVYYWLAYLYRNTSSQLSATYLNKAEEISPWLVFPFRPETMNVLEWALTQHYSWKTVYYAALIQWNSGNLSKTKELFEKCGSEPDYAPFYISRGILFSNDNTKKPEVLKDFVRAISLDRKEWRGWHALSNFYESNGSFSEQLDNAKKGYKHFPGNAVISIDYAKALLNVQNPKQSIHVLNTTLVLPQEGAMEGHELFVVAHISLALSYIRESKYKEAIEVLIKSKQYPENLGSGKPYNPDYRFQDYLIAYCEEQAGNKQKSSAYYQKIIDFSSETENVHTMGRAIDNYISVLVMERLGKEKEAKELLTQWQYYNDSLLTWQISGTHLPSQMEWVMGKCNNDSEKIRVLEKKITGPGNVTRFSLFLKALDIIEEKKKHNKF